MSDYLLFAASFSTVHSTTEYYYEYAGTVQLVFSVFIHESSLLIILL